MLVTNLHYKLGLVFLYSFFATFVSAEYLHYKFKKKGFVVKDMYKKARPIIANLGGTAALIGVMTAIVLSQIIVKEFGTARLLQFYFIVIVHATFGLIDDLINTSNKIKIIAPYFMALPISVIIQDTVINFFSLSFDVGLIFVYLIAPIYLMVVTNLINMHSGYNGLASGVSWILLLALGIRSFLKGDITMLFFLLPIFGAVTALHHFDKYPAKMIWGNIGSMMVGSSIGAYILISNAEWFGIVILIPHIVDFLLYIISMFIKKKKFEKIKFGRLRADNTIDPPTKWKLKFLIAYYFRVTEKRAVIYLKLLTAVFCIIALVSGI